MPVPKFSRLKIWLFCERRLFRIFSQFRGFSKKSTTEIGDFTLRKKKERKNTNGSGSKILASCNIGTKKHDQKERVDF